MILLNIHYYASFQKSKADYVPKNISMCERICWKSFEHMEPAILLLS